MDNLVNLIWLDGRLKNRAKAITDKGPVTDSLRKFSSDFPPTLFYKTGYVNEKNNKAYL